MIRLSLTSKILAIVGVVVFVVLGVSTAFHVVELRQGFKNDMYSSSEAMLAPILNDLMALGESSGDYEWGIKVQSIGVGQLFEDNRGRDISEIMLVDGKGVIGAHNVIERHSSKLDKALLSNLLTEEKQVLFHNNFYYVFIPVYLNKTLKIATAIVVFDSFKNKRKENLILDQSLGLFVLFLTLGLALAYVFIGRSLLNPVRALLKVSSEISRGNLDVDIDTSRRDELGALAWSIKNMRNAIQKNILELEAHQNQLEAEVKVRTAEANQARKQAEKFSHAKGEFLANMSHELRTPMNAIIGMSNLALKTDLNEKQKNYINKVNISAELLLGIINDVLDFSKIEQGMVEVETLAFNLQDVFDNVNNLLGLKAAEKGISLTFNISPQVPTLLLGDALRLGQVLTNLGGNALKFTQKGGISIRVQLGGKIKDNNEFLLKFEVEDSGIGISFEQQKHLFQPFSQADGSTTRKYGGSGLGLSICKNLVGLMGGNLKVESQKGIGSVFQFTVSVKAQSERAYLHEESTVRNKAVAAQHAREQLRGAKILLVEDNDINQELVVEILRAEGIKVVAVDDGAKAIAALEKERFDGVLMDCQMPVMDGYEATRKIRNKSRHKTVPIIAMTANVLKEDKGKAINAGMNDYIAKPINVDDMFITMSRWIFLQKSNAIIEKSSTVLTKQFTTLALACVPGIDMEKGLIVCSGNKKLFHRLLFKFQRSEKDFITRIKAGLRANNVNSVMHDLHSFKGAAGSLGATVLHSLATEIEGCCRENVNDERITILLNELDKKLNLLVEFLDDQLQDLPILIVEDSEIHQDILGQQLRILGYAFEVAKHGKEAIAFMQKKEFGLIIADLRMPEMDGFELIQKVRQQNLTLPIIVATSDVTLNNAGGCMELGANELVEKPIQLNELQALLQKWLPLLDYKQAILNKKRNIESASVLKGAPIDNAALEQYLPFDEATKLKYFRSYVSVRQKDVKLLTEGLKSADWDLADHFSHKLTAASRLIGALKMVGICHEIVAAKQQLKTKEAERLADRIQIEFDRVCKYVETLPSEAA